MHRLCTLKMVLVLRHVTYESEFSSPIRIMLDLYVKVLSSVLEPSSNGKVNLDVL